jgi:hypothetical protein
MPECILTNHMASLRLTLAHRPSPTSQSTPQAHLPISRRLLKARQHNSLQPRASLICLPAELLHAIVSFLPSPLNIIALRKTCQRFWTAIPKPLRLRKHYNRKELRRAIQTLQRQEKSAKGLLMCACCVTLHEENRFEAGARAIDPRERKCIIGRTLPPWF